MRISNNPSLLRILRACILIPITCLAVQATAADETQPAAAGEAAIPAQTGQQGKAAGSDASSNQEKPMEEITVIGQRQIFSLRKQVIQAEDHAFEIFNALNDDDDYDVHCEMRAPIGTHIKKRICLPNFYHKAAMVEGQSYISQIYGYTNYPVAAPTARSVAGIKFPIFKQKVREVAIKHPEMLAALRRLYELNEKLKKTRNTYHGVVDK